MTVLHAMPLDAVLRELASHLANVAGTARRLESTTEVPDARRAATLLAETAEVLHAAIADPRAEHWHRAARPELPWPLRLRLARLERWLTARAAAEAEATAAADLCLWLAEHLEATGG